MDGKTGDLLLRLNVRNRIRVKTTRGSSELAEQRFVLPTGLPAAISNQSIKAS